MGYSKDEMTAHGWRATASTLLNECGKWNEDAIERSLAHTDRTSSAGHTIAGAIGRSGWICTNGGVTISIGSAMVAKSFLSIRRQSLRMGKWSVLPRDEDVPELRILGARRS
jgi:hypothetical protein